MFDSIMYYYCGNKCATISAGVCAINVPKLNLLK